MSWEQGQYSKLINKILYAGEKRETRAGNAYSIFGEALSINVGHGFPLLHGRKAYYKGVLGELAAMLRGPKCVEDFKKFGCNYWDSWADEDGNLNVDYGNAWIDFNGVNQLDDLVQKLIENPTDRRMLVSGWRPDRLEELSLPCCHMLYQWYVREGNYLDMIWYQRSVDTMIGLPSDIILAAAWNIILAHQCGYRPGYIKMILGDTHIYENHLEPTLTYLRQLSKLDNMHNSLVKYVMKPGTTIKTFVPNMLELIGYEPMDAVKFDLNV